jgi:class 3 adenylate cyclase
MGVAVQTRYARSGDLSIAYQVVGDGPFDLVWTPPWISHVEAAWEEPRLAAFLERLASFSRLILFDKRGTGMSDRVPDDRLPLIEERMDDMRAVMDAAGSERAAVFGASEGATMAVLFAATYPGRATALVMFGSFASRVWSPEYPWAPRPDDRERFFDVIRNQWGQDMDVDDLAPSAAGDALFRERLTRFFRRAASPGAALALAKMNTQIDIRAILPTIHVPTLVLHRTGDRDANVEEGRWIAGQVPHARFAELDGEDHLPWVGDAESVLGEIEEFLTGARADPEPDRVLVTVLFTDVVGSTRRAAELGDHAWRELLDRHQEIVRRGLDRWRGREVDTAGDGFLAAFDGPARAIKCAREVQRASNELGLPIRSGVHTGECEQVNGDLRGIAVHIGARIAALANAGEVLASGTVKDLVAGSGLEFEDLGARELKGVPGEQRVFRVRD